MIGQILSWLWAWIAVPFAVRKFDLVVLPNENIPQNRIITLIRPTLICSFSLGNFEKAFILNHYQPDGKNYEKDFREKISSYYRDCIDYILGCGFRSWLPQHRPKKHYTLIGNLQREYLSRLGIDRSQMVVTGTPNLDNINDQTALEIDSAVGILKRGSGDFIVSVFPSSLTLDLDVFEDILVQMRFLHLREKALRIVVKLHPRFDATSLPKLEEICLQERFDITFVTSVFSDKENAALISVSDKVLISGGNIGVICCLLKKDFYHFKTKDDLPDIWAVSGISRPLNEIDCETMELESFDFSEIAISEICPSKKIAEYTQTLISKQNDEQIRTL